MVLVNRQNLWTEVKQVAEELFCSNITLKFWADENVKALKKFCYKLFEVSSEKNISGI